MIRRLTLKNFGPYETADVALNEFTTIVGPNGAGKSILFSALKAIGRVARYPMRYDRRQAVPHAVGFPTRTGPVDFKDIVHGQDLTRTIVLGVDFENLEVSGHYEVHLKHWEDAGGVICEERLSVTRAGTVFRVNANPDGYVDTNAPGGGRFRTPRFVSILGVLFSSRDAQEKDIARTVQRVLADGIGVYRFDPTALKAPAELGRAFSPTGYNFANYLDEIQNDPNGRAAFDALLERFRQICPHVKDVSLPTERTNGGVRKRISLVTTNSGGTIPVDLESDGTILMLAYASLLHGKMARDTLCIEEPENGVHPKIIPAQVKMFRELAQPKGDRAGAQILVCTHSRRFLDAVEAQPSAVRLVRRNDDGRSTVETPTDAQRPALAGWAGLS